MSATSRDREERVRRTREQQEDDRRKKLEELKEHVSQVESRGTSKKVEREAKINEENWERQAIFRRHLNSPGENATNTRSNWVTCDIFRHSALASLAAALLNHA